MASLLHDFSLERVRAFSRKIFPTATSNSCTDRWPISCSNSSNDFPRIGSLPTPTTGFPSPPRPLTWKVHDIIQNGGVDTFGMSISLNGMFFFRSSQDAGDRAEGFETTSQYFKYLLGQDWQQLHQQPKIQSPVSQTRNHYSPRSKS